MILKKENKLLGQYQLTYLQLDILIQNILNTAEKGLVLIEIISRNQNLSINFKQILYRIMNGEDIYSNLSNLLFYSPSFLNYWGSILDVKLDKGRTKLIDNFHDKYEEKYQIFVKSLETKLNFFFFFLIFTPIAFLFYISQQKLNIYFIVISIFFYCLIQKFFLHKHLEANISLLGFFDIKEDFQRIQLESFLVFINHFSYNLIQYSADLAFFISIDQLSEKEKSVLNIKEEDIRNFHFFFDLQKNFERLFQRIQNERFQSFYYFFSNILQKSPKPEHFQTISIQLKKHIKLMNEQNIIMKSFVFKINTFKVLLTIILAILSALLSRLNVLFIMISNDFSLIDFQAFFIVRIVFFVIAFVFLFSSLIFFNLLFSNKILTFLDFMCFFVYIFIYLYSNSLIAFYL